MDLKKILTEQKFRSQFENGLKKMRKSAGYSQEQISDILDVERSTYTYYELGKTRPSPYQIYRLLCLYQISFDMLICKETNKKKAAEKDADKGILTISSLCSHEKLLIACLRLSEDPIETAKYLTAELKK